MPEWVNTVGALLGIVGGLGGAIAIARERGLRSTLEAYREGNQGLRELWEAEKEAKEDAEARHATAMREQDEACAQRLAAQDEKIARQQGQLDAIQSGIVATLVEQLKVALVDAVHAALNSPERRTS